MLASHKPDRRYAFQGRITSLGAETACKLLRDLFLDFRQVQKQLAEGVWYSPSNKKVKLDAKYDARLFNTEAKVAQLIQPDWKWYNARKDDIDARVTRILKG